MSNDDDFLPAPLVCLICNEEFELAEGLLEHTCEHCGNPIGNMQAQFTYSRGYDAFFAGQRVYMEIPPKRRSAMAYAAQAQETTQLYSEAYTALQEAFQSNLADSQRYKAIEMMASISSLFMQTGLVSPLEAGYWTSLMVEQVNRKEYEELVQKLSQPKPGFLASLVRLNWHRRKRILAKALARQERRIQLIEQNIAFVTPPRVRKSSTSGMGANYA
jgi:hypothetical protein